MSLKTPKMLADDPNYHPFEAIGFLLLAKPKTASHRPQETTVAVGFNPVARIHELEAENAALKTKLAKADGLAEALACSGMTRYFDRRCKDALAAWLKAKEQPQ